ncbi:glycosyl hydrolase family 28-related protein [Spirosoma flavum]|uniref:Glycosyl hydrolase family 28-related protein n=1 Tax=Spirosoma flavum TaxID=2048557 RepID=A0ABW6AFK2_9BACT
MPFINEQVSVQTYAKDVIEYTNMSNLSYNLINVKGPLSDNSCQERQIMPKNSWKFSYAKDSVETTGNVKSNRIHIEGISNYIPNHPQYIDVRNYGAKGNGVTDDTQAFQKAIDYANTSGIKLVMVSRGNYKITNTIIVRSGVTLQGAPKIPFKANFAMDFALISVKTQQGNIKKSVFVIEMGAGIKGFSFYWPDQMKTAKIPIPYGWAITTTGKQSGADNIQIEDIMLTNCYNGINVDFGGQLNVRNIFGQTFNIGIRLDRLYDVSRLENVHFWDFWANEGSKAKSYIQINGKAVVIGRVDGLQGTNIFAYGHKNVLNFVDFGYGSAWGQFSNVTADVCYIPIQIDKVNIVQLINVNGTIWDKKTGKSFIETGTNIIGEVSITNLNAYLPQTVINISSTSGVFKLTNITARKRGLDQFDVFQYKIINQSTAKVFIDEADYNEVSGIVQIGTHIKFSSDEDITASIENFSSPYKWNNNSGRVTPIQNGSRFVLNGKIEVARIPVPLFISNNAGVYIIECDIKLNNPENLNADGQFYLRLTDFTINDVILPGNPLNGFFTEKTHLRIPFIVRKSGLYFDFVFGNNSNIKESSMDISNLKIYHMDTYKTTRSLIDWLHVKQPNALNLPLPKVLK